MQFDCDSSVLDWLVTPGNRDRGIPLTCGKGGGGKKGGRDNHRDVSTLHRLVVLVSYTQNYFTIHWPA